LEKSLTKKTFNGLIWLGGVKVTNAVLQFGILAILARLLSPSEFGLIGLALLVVAFSEIFNDLGFGPAITQKQEISKLDINTAFTASFIFGLFLLLILNFLAGYIASFFNAVELENILKAISIVLFFNALSTTPLGIMYRNMEFRKISIIQTTSYLFGYGSVGVTLAFLGYGVWSLVIGVICQSIIAFFLYLIFGKNKFRFLINKSSFFLLLHFGGGYSLSKIFTFAGNRGDKLLVGRLLGLDALGLYERGYQLVKYIGGLLGEIIDKVLFSPIARRQNNKDLVGAVYMEITYMLAMLFLPLSGFIFCNAEFIIKIILGNQWSSTIDIVKIMSPTIFFLICTRVGSTVAKSLGDVYRRAWRTFFYSIYIIVAVYISSEWGIEGVAFSVTIGAIINYLLAFGQVHLLTNVKYLKFLEGHGAGIVLLLFYLLFYFLIKKAFLSEMDSDFVQLLIGGKLLLIVYLIGYLMDYKEIFTKYYKYLLNK
jgi:O-antigen/teichoic acid export membrane protein